MITELTKPQRKKLKLQIPKELVETFSKLSEYADE
jgi:hypothetical protein